MRRIAPLRLGVRQSSAALDSTKLTWTKLRCIGSHTCSAQAAEDCSTPPHSLTSYFFRKTIIDKPLVSPYGAFMTRSSAPYDAFSSSGSQSTYTILHDAHCMRPSSNGLNVMFPQVHIHGLRK